MSFGRPGLRALASGTILGLATATVALVGPAAPASAAPIDYDCTVPVLGSLPFGTDFTSNMPTTIEAGETVVPQITGLLTLPSAVADLLRTIPGGAALLGTISGDYTVDGLPVPGSLSFDDVPIPASGELPIGSVGSLPPITGGNPGEVIEILAPANQDVVVQLLDALGLNLLELPIPCAAALGEALGLSQTTVVKARSTTGVRASYAKRRDLVKATSVVRSSTGIATPGKVRFVLKRGTNLVKKTTKTLRSGKATAKFWRVSRPGRYKVIATYVGSERVERSSSVDRFRIRR